MLESSDLENEKKKKRTSAIIKQKSDDQCSVNDALIMTEILKHKTSNCVSAVSSNNCEKIIESLDWPATDTNMKCIKNECSSDA